MLSTTSINFGSVSVGMTKSVPISLTNSGVNATIQVFQVSVSGSGFNTSGLTPPIQIAPGQTVTMNATFMPTAGGTTSGSISIQSTASNAESTVTLSGSGTVSAGQLSVSSGALAFGSVQVGSSKSLPLTLTNPSSSSSSIHVTQLNVTGTGFAVSGATLPLTLTAGQSFTVNASFAPSAMGSANGSLTIVSDASNPSVSVSLSGSGSGPGQLAVSPGTMNFGSVTVGNSQSQSGTLTASGGSVTVSSASWNGSGFSLSGISFPTILASGQTTSFTVTFLPQTAGTVSGTATFVSDAANSPTVEQLSGTGVQPAQHSVSLSWNASTSSVQGYYVYRGGQTGGPYSKVSTLVPQLTYTDSSVVSGSTYYYVVTALGTDNVESGNSNQVTAVIP